MEETLHVYEQGHDPESLVVCFDERPCFLIGDVMQPMPMKPGQSQRIQYEYEKNGSCPLLLAVEPLRGFRYLEVRERRTKADYAHFMKNLALQYPEAERIVLIQDNLNTHNPSSFYENFQAQEAFELAQRFQMKHTKKKASWLNMAEIELSAFGKQCLNRRIADMDTLKEETKALAKKRNEK